MRSRRVSVGFAAAVLLVAAGCGDGDGDGALPDRSTSTTVPDSAASTTTTTTRPPITTTTRPPLTTTSAPPETTTTAPATTTTAAPTTTTAAPTTTTATSETTTTTTTTVPEDEVAGAPAADEGEEDDAWWWWLLIPLVAAAVAGFVVWRRSTSTPSWEERASQLADEIDAAGRSVLLGPDLTADLWDSALTRSNEVRAGAATTLDQAPTPAARQAVQEAVDALRAAEVAANTARQTPGTDLSASAAELTAAVERLRAVSNPTTPAG